MDCSSREVISPSQPQGPPPFHDSFHPALRSDASTSPAIHPFPPLQKAPLSPSPGPDAIFLASVKLDCSPPESGDGIFVRSKEAAPLEYPGSEPGSAELKPESVEIQMNPCPLTGTSPKLHTPCIGSNTLPP
ncbi:hypothetical protein Nepgr_009361 [Nepenthes gracilis]|uniref:Uncharacterized protein n=1 Tax=Nepenthes gracilis TaxID=150966 RepID=A0AAD3SB59_NEPGR|nr:hypothetical protein Nepgr_009361 [Nepenthes gracilis]